MALLLALVALGGASSTAAAAPTRALAPPGACPGATDPKAHHRTQRLAMHCLVRWARATAQVPDVTSSVTLRHSATLKARRIAECRTFTHSPCGDPFGTALHRVTLKKKGSWLLGENLAWGVGGRATARHVIANWLQSKAHREVLTDPRLVQIGVRRRRLTLDGAPKGAVLWVLHMGTRR